MRGVRIPHDLNGQDRFVLGLSITNLAVLLFGLLGAYTVLHLRAPFPLRLSVAILISGAAACLAWLRPEGRSLLHWMLAAIEFKFSRDAVVSPPRARPGPVGQRPHLAVLPSADDSEKSPEPPDRENDEVVELPSQEHESDQPVEDPDTHHPVPVYLGGSQIVTFFSAKGGTGRTTLATEIACLLALEGWYRDSPQHRPVRLNVVLADFDLGSANVSVRVGLAQPTILDYLTDLSQPSPNLSEYVLRHQPSNLRVLLGPPKCFTTSYPQALSVAQAAQILTALRSEGYHFIFVDIGSTLGDLETFLLQASDRILCVVTPTAGSVQDLYRGVEALRRLGLGSKLGYVANKMCDRLDLSEPMGDLGGTLIARVPDDPSFDVAENRHHPFVLEGKGETRQALAHLASALYPALRLPEFGEPGGGWWSWLGRRRHAG